VNEEKGYGFIIPSDGGKKIFYHISEVEGKETLKEGDEVEYSLGTDRYLHFGSFCVCAHAS
jgi:CspA family cold shock protein